MSYSWLLYSDSTFSIPVFIFKIQCVIATIPVPFLLFLLLFTYFLPLPLPLKFIFPSWTLWFFPCFHVLLLTDFNLFFWIPFYTSDSEPLLNHLNYCKLFWAGSWAVIKSPGLDCKLFRAGTFFCLPIKYWFFSNE